MCNSKRKKKTESKVLEQLYKSCFFNTKLPIPPGEVGKGDITMSDFKVIETQEQLDAILGDRLKRERETVKKEFEGYLSPEDAAKKYEGYLSPEDEKKKYEGYLSPEEAAKKDAKIKGYESSSVKTRIAHETGLPYEMAARLSGETEEDIRKDAESLVKLIGQQQPPQPFGNSEFDGKASGTREALRRTLNGLKGE